MGDHKKVIKYLVDMARYTSASCNDESDPFFRRIRGIIQEDNVKSEDVVSILRQYAVLYNKVAVALEGLIVHYPNAKDANDAYIVVGKMYELLSGMQGHVLRKQTCEPTQLKRLEEVVEKIHHWYMCMLSSSHAALKGEPERAWFLTLRSPTQERIELDIMQKAKAEEPCSICLNEPNKEEVKGNLDRNVSQLPCGHSFHPDCIGKWTDTCWIARNPITCPTCRKDKIFANIYPPV